MTKTIVGHLNVGQTSEYCQGCGQHEYLEHLKSCPTLKPRDENPEHDTVNHPKHYTSHPSGIECIQVTEHFSFNLGNVIKYLWRAEEKGAPLEDLKKAAWYLNREIQKREGK